MPYEINVRPIPDAFERKVKARIRRNNATTLSGPDVNQIVPSNGEETDHGFAPVSNFSKGLYHDEYGLASAEDYKAFVTALTRMKKDVDGVGEFNVPGPYLDSVNRKKDGKADTDKNEYRQWESPLAGLYYSLEGPDPAALAIAPAPRLGSSELCAEMAEVYAFAIVRDMTLEDLGDDKSEVFFKDNEGATIPFKYPADHPKAGDTATMSDIRDELAKLNFLNPQGTPVSSQDQDTLTSHEKNRRRARFEDGDYTLNSMFRGSTPGSQAGPMLSQFLLLGTNGRQKSGIDPKKSGIDPTNGDIQFGAQSISQKISKNTPGLDFMTEWDKWLEVQNAVKPKDPDNFFTGDSDWISTPRDLATYVHYDQLYQAYFNACLIMLTNGVPFSSGFPNGTKDSPRGPFASFGGPHILSLMTEVASRALKAVRRQKFQVHRRGRPEVLAARLTQVQGNHCKGMNADAIKNIRSMLKELGADNPADHKRPGVLLHWINQINDARNINTKNPKWMKDGKNFLLPMAFPEGSPMHPAYGAGHATVAGACVTVLKAFFQMDGDGAQLTKALKVTENYKGPASKDGTLQEAGAFKSKQSLEGELNKLAANISIGRNMAGVHFYSDYFDSLRLGERIAAGILEEQMLNYNEAVSMSFNSFDGDPVEIKTNGGEGPQSVHFLVSGGSVHREVWFDRHVADHLPPYSGS